MNERILKMCIYTKLFQVFWLIYIYTSNVPPFKKLKKKITKICLTELREIVYRNHINKTIVHIFKVMSF